MFLFLLACTSGPCRDAKASVAATWTAAAEALDAATTQAHTQAAAGLADASGADDAQGDVIAAPKPKGPVAHEAQEAYTRALAGGGTYGAAATAAAEADLAGKLRRTAADAETAAREADAYTTRVSTWAKVESDWRRAGGLARAAAYAHQVVDGKTTAVPLELLPVQSGNTRTLPESPIDLEDYAVGAAQAHAGLLRVVDVATRATPHLEGASRDLDQLVLEAGSTATGELLSAANEGKLAQRHVQATLAALATARSQADAAGTLTTLELGGAEATVTAAQAASTALASACR